MNFDLHNRGGGGSGVEGEITGDGKERRGEEGRGEKGRRRGKKEVVEGVINIKTKN
jgi:hypothetical protein